MRIDSLIPQIVELVPKPLLYGYLYISPKYKSAVHLCCCGCGEKVVTPLSPAEWCLSWKDIKASLHPSIGNWSMPCQSHYFIRNNRVVWAGQMSKQQIRVVHARDKAALEVLHRENALKREFTAASRKVGFFKMLKDRIVRLCK